MKTLGKKDQIKKKSSNVVTPKGEKNQNQNDQGKKEDLILDKIKKLGNQGWNPNPKHLEIFKRIRRTNLSKILGKDCCLLIDVRSKKEYKEKHIQTAKTFEHSNLTRSNPFKSCHEILTSKNKKNKIIVVYSNGEDIGPKTATRLSEMGFDNVYLLSGGLIHFSRKYENLLKIKENDWVPNPFLLYPYNNNCFISS